MATIDKKLIHFNRKADFEARLAAGDIRDYSIVCIKDAKLIWTHGEYYGDLSECLTKYPQEFTKEEKDQMLENLGYYAVEWDGASETIELSDEEYRKVSSATNVMLVIFGGIYLLPMMKGGSAYGYSIVSGDVFASYTLDTSTNPLSITAVGIDVPSKTSDLENDSSFVSAVDTGEEVDDVEVNYVTEAELTSELAKKQDKLVSGTNIKTINGESILGSGDIVIEGGLSNGGSGAYAEVNHGTSDTSFTLTPNTFHVWDEVPSLDLSFADETTGVANEYLFQFTSGATATTLTLPDGLKFMEDLQIEGGAIYQVSILNNLVSVLKWENEIESYPISFFVNDVEYQAENGMSWRSFINSEYNPVIENTTDKYFIEKDSYPAYALLDEGEVDMYTGLIDMTIPGYPGMGDLIVDGRTYEAL